MNAWTARAALVGIILGMAYGAYEVLHDPEPVLRIEIVVRPA